MPQSVGLIPAHAGKTCPCRARLLVEWAHPRSRGENLIVDRPANPQAGSSPLTRGKLPSWTRSLLTARLIPAHAGKTAVVDTLIADRAAHPRSRGENQHDGPVTVEAHGSSPLTRGKRCLVWSARFFDGLIPAHAGKTGPTVGAGPPRGAHPRSRGENHAWARTVAIWLGSSPLTRGKHRKVHEDHY